MTHKLAIAMSAGRRTANSAVSAVAGDYSLIIVCLVFVLFALAGYGMAELAMLD